jgi:uroporphyrinogen-III synthase
LNETIIIIGKLKVSKILVSQPRPAVIEKSPFYEFSQKNELSIDYKPLIRVDGVTLKEFRAQRSEILDHTTMIFSSRTTIDSFFRICEEARITVPETMKYICNTEAVALYLQKYIVYRKRKISFADGTFTNLLELIIKHKSERFLLALSEPHKPELPETLTKLKINYDPVILALTVAADMSDVKPSEYDVMALYSPSDVKSVMENFKLEELPVIATFGEATLRAALDAGMKVRASAPSPEAPSMAKALDLYISKVKSGETVAEVEIHQDEAKEEFIRTQQSKLAKKGRTRTSTAEKK